MKTLYLRCAGVDVHKGEVVACLRLATKGKVVREVRCFPTTTKGLCDLAEWLEDAQCTHLAMEARGVYWKPGDGTCYHDLGPEWFVRRNPAKIAAKLAERMRNLGYHVEISAAA